MKHLPQYFFLSGILLTFGSELNMLKAGKRNYENNAKPERRPNVIFFATDDLNDWVSPLGYKQAKTPNLERLAKRGIVFTYAQAPGVFSAPSRTAIMTGLNASTTGCYGEDPFQYDHPELVTMQMAFKQGGYNTYGAGKIYHHRGGFVDLRGWDKYFARSKEVINTGWEIGPYHFKDNHE